MCRKRGRIVLVGVTGLELSRDDFYEKELTFQVSCSYGPGRYDPAYEEGGQDYPAGFVRWTAQRNFEAVLDMMRDGRLDRHPADLPSLPARGDLMPPTPRCRTSGLWASSSISDRASPTRALRSCADRSVRLRCGQWTCRQARRFHRRRQLRLAHAHACIRQGRRRSMVSVAANSGVNALQGARKFKFTEVSTDVAATIGRADIDAVVIATRHDSHADLVQQALCAGKHVFVEKPLCTTFEQLSEIERKL